MPVGGDKARKGEISLKACSKINSFCRGSFGGTKLLTTDDVPRVTPGKTQEKETSEMAALHPDTNIWRLLVTAFQWLKTHWAFAPWITTDSWPSCERGGGFVCKDTGSPCHSHLKLCELEFVLTVCVLCLCTVRMQSWTDYNAFPSSCLSGEIINVISFQFPFHISSSLCWFHLLLFPVFIAFLCHLFQPLLSPTKTCTLPENERDRTGCFFHFTCCKGQQNGCLNQFWICRTFLRLRDCFDSHLRVLF